MRIRRIRPIVFLVYGYQLWRIEIELRERKCEPGRSQKIDCSPAIFLEIAGSCTEGHNN
jgi:hypothetical protein